MKTYIVVATHKRFEGPSLPDCYHITKNGSVYENIEDYDSDAIGENISSYQPLLCELTSLYCAWKNKEYDILGLCHYRRYFSWEKDNSSDILSKIDYEKILQKYDVILPPKCKYYFVTPTEYYVRFHNKKTRKLRQHYIELLKSSIVECFPEYEKSMIKVFNRKSAHLKNMFVMNTVNADKYCSFVFAVLEALNKKEKFRDRALGTVGEYLMDVWIEHNHMNYLELPIYSQEQKNSIIQKGLKKIWKKS